MMVSPPFTGPRFPGDVAARGADSLAGVGHALHAERNVTVGGTEVVLRYAVVVGQLQLGLAVPVAPVERDERQGVLL